MTQPFNWLTVVVDPDVPSGLFALEGPDGVQHYMFIEKRKLKMPKKEKKQTTVTHPEDVRYLEIEGTVRVVLPMIPGEPIIIEEMGTKGYLADAVPGRVRVPPNQWLALIAHAKFGTLDQVTAAQRTAEVYATDLFQQREREQYPLLTAFGGGESADPDAVEAAYDLREQVRSALHAHHREDASDTPDFVLAHYLLGCLEVFERATNRRDHWNRDRASLASGSSMSHTHEKPDQ